MKQERQFEVTMRDLNVEHLRAIIFWECIAYRYEHVIARSMTKAIK